MADNVENCDIECMYISVLEFIYFLAIYVKEYGPSPATVLSKHILFFKPEVQIFVDKFNGQNVADKLNSALILISEVFDICQGNALSLKTRSKIFVETISKSIVTNKTARLINQGILNLNDILVNINRSSCFKVSYEQLVLYLKNENWCTLHDDCTASLTKEYCVKELDTQTVKEVTKYFVNSIENDNFGFLLFEDIINFHKKNLEILVKDKLLLLCILCSQEQIFLCQNGSVSLQNSTARVESKDALNSTPKHTAEMSGEIPFGILVSKLHGRTLLGWKGEIVRLMQRAGFIRAKFYLSNGFTGVFFVYFHRTAFKKLRDVMDLGMFLKTGNNVVFDAIFSDESEAAKRNNRFWKAITANVIPDLCESLTNDSYGERNSKFSKPFLCDHSVTKQKPSGKDSNVNHKKKSSLNNDLFSTRAQSCSLPQSPPVVVTNYTCLNLSFGKTSTFIFAEVILLTENDGMLLGQYENKAYKMFFIREAVSSQDGTVLCNEDALNNYLSIGKTVITFVPYFEQNVEVLLPTLVCPVRNDIFEKDSEISPEDYFRKVFFSAVNNQVEVNCLDINITNRCNCSGSRFKWKKKIDYQYLSTCFVTKQNVANKSEKSNIEERSTVTSILTDRHSEKNVSAICEKLVSVIFDSENSSPNGCEQNSSFSNIETNSENNDHLFPCGHNCATPPIINNCTNSSQNTFKDAFVTDNEYIVIKNTEAVSDVLHNTTNINFISEVNSERTEVVQNSSPVKLNEMPTIKRVKDVHILNKSSGSTHSYHSCESSSCQWNSSEDDVFLSCDSVSGDMDTTLLPFEESPDPTYSCNKSSNTSPICLDDRMNLVHYAIENVCESIESYRKINCIPVSFESNLPLTTECQETVTEFTPVLPVCVPDNSQRKDAVCIDNIHFKREVKYLKSKMLKNNKVNSFRKKEIKLTAKKCHIVKAKFRLCISKKIRRFIERQKTAYFCNSCYLSNSIDQAKVMVIEKNCVVLVTMHKERPALIGFPASYIHKSVQGALKIGTELQVAVALNPVVTNLSKALYFL